MIPQRLDPNPMSTLRPSDAPCCFTCRNCCECGDEIIQCSVLREGWTGKSVANPNFPHPMPRWSGLMICDFYRPKENS